MLFNSYTFWVFFAVVACLYYALPHRWQNRQLLVASYVFYGWWDWRFLSLILVSTVVDYFAALGIESSGGQGACPKRPLTKRLWMVLSIVVNLGLLGFFKYFGFFATELVELLRSLGVNGSLASLKIVLPVGISFYTFQTMSYTIDVYRGQTSPTRSLPDFALYVAFFPQLVAGPIERSTSLLPQILNPRRFRGGEFSDGLYLVLLGLFKKVVIADNMAFIVDGVFKSNPSELSGLDCLVGVYAFALQIYGDFSGYSAIARGVAKWLGFDLMVNFRMPYFARSPREFWQRWHISLSTWLRDYLYIPLGGNRRGTFRTYRNLMITMLLGGLWHGAGWTFLAWGLFHGSILCIYRAFGYESQSKELPSRARLLRSLLWGILMFHLVCIGWLLFRAESIGQAYCMLMQILTDVRVTDLAVYAVSLMLFYAGPLVVLEAWLERKDDLLRLVKVHWLIRAGVYSYFTLMILLFHPTVHNEFIYFQF